MDADGGRRKRSAWIKHVMSFKKPGMSLGDAMKAAKPSWHKTSKAKKGGTLMDKMGPMGGRRGKHTRKSSKKMLGGTAYGFTGGPYTGSDLPDGNSRFPALSDATWKGPSELLGGKRSRKVAGRRRRGGALAAPSSDGHEAQLPYKSASVAPATSVGENGAFSSSGDVPKSSPLGGRRSRSRRHRGGSDTKGSAMVYGASSSEAHRAATAAAAARNGYA